MRTYWRNKSEMRDEIEKLRKILGEVTEEKQFDFQHVEVKKINQLMDLITTEYLRAFDLHGRIFLWKIERRKALSSIKDRAVRLGIDPFGLSKTALIRAIQQAEKHDTCYALAAACIENCPWKNDCKIKFALIQSRLRYLHPLPKKWRTKKTI